MLGKPPLPPCASPPCPWPPSPATPLELLLVAAPVPALDEALLAFEALLLGPLLVSLDAHAHTMIEKPSHAYFTPA
jgi:hypothetical protein